MRRKMDIAILAQLTTRSQRSICTEVSRSEIRSRGRNRQDAFSFLPGEGQSRNYKLSARAAGKVFDDSSVVRRVDGFCFRAIAITETRISSRENRIPDHCDTLRRASAAGQTLTLHSQR